MLLGAQAYIIASSRTVLVAAANISYLVVFVLMPLAFVILRRRRLRLGEPVVLSRPWTAVGVVVFALNAVLLVVGAALWVAHRGRGHGLDLPLMALRRWGDAARRGRTVQVGEVGVGE